jgi:hypothetical protein
VGWSNDLGNQGDMIGKAGLAEAKARDAGHNRLPIEGEDIHWPVAAVVRIVLIALAVLIVAGWLLTAFNH